MIKPLRSDARKNLSFDEPANARFILKSGVLLIAIVAARLVTLVA